MKMGASFQSLFLLSMAVILVSANAEEPECEEGVFKIIPKDDCTGYFMCDHGQPIEMFCQPGYVFSTSASVCVPKDSFWDDCSTTG